MTNTNDRLCALGLHLPAPLQAPDGTNARSAVGMAELPVGIPVEIEAEVEID